MDSSVRARCALGFPQLSLENTRVIGMHDGGQGRSNKNPTITLRLVYPEMWFNQNVEEAWFRKLEASTVYRSRTWSARPSLLPSPH